MTEADRNPSVGVRRMSRLIRLNEVKHRIGLSRATINRRMGAGKFPKLVRFGGYIVAWDEQVITAWIAQRGVGKPEE